MLTKERAVKLAWLHVDLSATLYEETASIKAVHREELFDSETSWYATLNKEIDAIIAAMGRPLMDAIRPWESKVKSPERTKSHELLNTELETLLTDALLAAAPGEPEEQEMDSDPDYGPDPEYGF